jgi:hypothetical protein
MLEEEEEEVEWISECENHSLSLTGFDGHL